MAVFFNPFLHTSPLKPCRLRSPTEHNVPQSGCTRPALGLRGHPFLGKRIVAASMRSLIFLERFVGVTISGPVNTAMTLASADNLASLARETHHGNAR